MTYYAIQDEATGLFYRGSNFKVAQKPDAIITCASGHRMAMATRAAKRFEDLHWFEQHFRLITGYYQPDEEKVPRVIRYRFGVVADYLPFTDELPPTFIPVQVNPKARTITKIDFPLHEIFDRTVRRRELNINFGPSLISLMEKIDESSKRDLFTHALVFAPPVGHVGGSDHQELEAAIKIFGGRKTLIRCSELFSTAIGFHSDAEAVKFRLGYAGKFSVKIAELNSFK